MRKFVTLTLVASLAIIPIAASITRAQQPLTYVRRAESAMILIKHAGIKVQGNAKTYGQYPDVLDGEWYVPFVIKGLELALFSVDETTGLVYPHHSVSRADFLMMMTKVFDLTTNIPYSYTDVKPGSEASHYAGLSWRYKLFNNDANPLLLQPKLRVTHKEAAKAVYNLMTAEPQLQPIPGMFPVRNFSRPNAPKPALVEVVTNQIRETAQEVTETYIDVTTPKIVKSAMLKMIQSRGSLAEITRNDLIQAVNDVREQYKVPPLRSNYYLELSAQRHAKDMADRGYFSHYTPSGLSYVDRIRAGGYLDVNPESCSCSQEFDLGGNPIDHGGDYLITGQQQCSCEPTFSLGENLAKGQLSVKQVVKDWMDSPNHRKNLLRPEFEEIGIGLYEDIWVQNFGRLTFE